MLICTKAHPTARPAIRIFHTSVSRAERLNAHMMRITLQGGDLATFESAGPDSFVYVFFPRRGEEERYAVAHDFTWDFWRALPEDERPIGRYYTVRSFNTAAAAMEIDIVVHGEGPVRPGHPSGLALETPSHSGARGLPTSRLPLR